MGPTFQKKAREQASVKSTCCGLQPKVHNIDHCPWTPFQHVASCGTFLIEKFHSIRLYICQKLSHLYILPKNAKSLLMLWRGRHLREKASAIWKRTNAGPKPRFSTIFTKPKLLSNKNPTKPDPLWCELLNQKNKERIQLTAVSSMMTYRRQPL